MIVSLPTHPAKIAPAHVLMTAIMTVRGIMPVLDGGDPFSVRLVPLDAVVRLQHKLAGHAYGDCRPARSAAGHGQGHVVACQQTRIARHGLGTIEPHGLGDRLIVELDGDAAVRGRLPRKSCLRPNLVSQDPPFSRR